MAPGKGVVHVSVTVACAIPDSFFHSSTDRLLSDPELSAAESPLADKKAPGSERAAERAAQQNNERARLAPRPSYVNMQVMSEKKKKMRESSKYKLSRLREMGNSVNL